MTTELRESFQAMASQLLLELETDYLHVVLVPAPEQRHDGHMIRLASNHNPQWYKNLYHGHPDGKFSRRLLVEALTRLSDKIHLLRKYDYIAHDLIKDLLLIGRDGAPPCPHAENFWIFQIDF